jgi:hypothetical protein
VRVGFYVGGRLVFETEMPCVPREGESIRLPVLSTTIRFGEPYIAIVWVEDVTHDLIPGALLDVIVDCGWSKNQDPPPGWEAT